jgi:hypothetical protein
MFKGKGALALGAMTLLLVLGMVSTANATMTLVGLPEIDTYDVKEGEPIDVSFTVQSTGTCTGMGYDYALIEVCIDPRTDIIQTSVLGAVGEQKSCCAGNVWCVHREVKLRCPTGVVQGESVKVTLTPTAPTPSSYDHCGSFVYWNGYGRYNVNLLSVDSCCIGNPLCKAVPPFGWAYKAGEIYIIQPNCNNNNVCEAGETYENCRNDCPTGCGDDICQPGEVCPMDCDIFGKILDFLFKNWVLFVAGVSIIVIGLVIRRKRR